MIDRLDPSLAPGCYGSALAFREGSPECSTCPFVEKCRPIAAKSLAYIREKYGIAAKLQRDKPKPDKIVPHGGSLDGALPKKVETLMQRIERAGVKITEALRQGRNPFATAPIFMKVACHLLLRLPDGFTKAELKGAYISKLKWTEGTAAAHALQAWQLLKAVGAADERNDRLVLRKSA